MEFEFTRVEVILLPTQKDELSHQFINTSHLWKIPFL
jgi:hypothetical protein